VTTESGAATTYAPPATVLVPPTVTIKATFVADAEVSRETIAAAHAISRE
jgi:hypothetical protein